MIGENYDLEVINCFKARAILPARKGAPPTGFQRITFEYFNTENAHLICKRGNERIWISISPFIMKHEDIGKEFDMLLLPKYFGVCSEASEKYSQLGKSIQAKNLSNTYQPSISCRNRCWRSSFAFTPLYF